MTKQQQNRLKNVERLKKNVHDRLHTSYKDDCEYCRKQREDEAKQKKEGE